MKQGPSPKPQTDWWQKVSVVSTVLSTVVLAAIGLMIQRSNAITADALSRAQLEVAKAKNTDDIRIQEGQLVSGFLKQTFELNGKHRAVILVVLKDHMPQQGYTALCAALAQEDSKEAVRVVAIRQLGTTANQNGAQILSSIAKDS